MLNPLFIKEFRIQTRNRKLYAISIFYIFALSALAFGLIWSVSTGEASPSPERGRYMFLAYIVALILAVCLICPAFTVGVISSEREQLTFDQLRMTLLKPRQILLGKALPPIIYISILLFASLPATILIAPFGGISPSRMAFCYLMIFSLAATFGLIGLMWSSIYRSTKPAAIMTYAITGFLVIGTLLIPVVLTETFQLNLGRILKNLLMVMNPFHAVFSIFSKDGQFQLTGLPTWSVAILGYLIISTIAICVSLLRAYPKSR